MVLFPLTSFHLRTQRESTVVGERLRHPFEGLEVRPALQLVYHGLVDLGRVLTNFVHLENVVHSLDNCPLESRCVKLDDVVLTFAKGRQAHRLVWD